MDPRVLDRAVGVLLGSAAGDALGVPYEFGMPPLDTEPEQKGGGLGGLTPGQGVTRHPHAPRAQLQDRVRP